MAPFSNLGESINKHIYSILAVLLIGIVTFGYLSYILPKNQAKEDAKNAAILKGIENQLIIYIDDQIKYIDENQMKADKFLKYKDSANIFIDTIRNDKKKTIQLQQGIIKFPRVIDLKRKGESSKIDSINDVTNIDLVRFINKISSTTPFTSFYICPVENRKCQTENTILSRNVSVVDQDSLVEDNRKRSFFDFKKSQNRYYTDHVYIPQTNHTIFLAVGIDKTIYQNSVQQINTTLLIFSLVATIILILGINFIKPVISSYKETLSQIDLIGVVFSSGLLVAVLVVFTSLSCWKNNLTNRNEKDLKQLVTLVDSSFTKQINTYKDWKKRDNLFGEIWKNSENEFAKITVEDKKIIILPNRKGDSLKYNSNPKQLTAANSKLIEYLDGYFRMDTEGLITTNLSKTLPEVPRKYAERNYFKTLKSRNKENQKEPVLTAVFSREENKYQLIYAENDILDDKKQNPKNTGISGFAFREYFSDEVKLPPGTGYMLIDISGNVLMQNDPEKNLYQNLRTGSQNNNNIIKLLSGDSPKSFEMEYQGTQFQVYAQKLNSIRATPTYILGTRELTHLNRLEIYNFTNGFLISVLFGLCMLLLTYTYSVLFYSGRIHVLSMQHFFHLFPDKSRTNEYKMLMSISCVSIFLAILISLFTSPESGFLFCVILGINIVIINFITLSIRTPKFQTELTKIGIYLFFAGICLPMIVFSISNLFYSIITVLVSHMILIFHYKNWRNREELTTWKKWQDLGLNAFVKKNTSVNRSAYTQFLTVRLLYQFAIFPFILVGAIYASELNEFTSYYCSSLNIEKPKEADKIFILQNRQRNTDAYNCNCEDITKDSLNNNKPNYKNILQMANLGLLDRPADYEIEKFTFNQLISNNYLNLNAIFQTDNDFLFRIMVLLIISIFLSILAYHLLNYYSNRFFFYDLMQAGYEKYYPWKKNEFASDEIIIPMIEDDEIRKLIELGKNKKIVKKSIHPQLTNFQNRVIDINQVFAQDKDYEVSLSLRKSFILNYNIRELEEEYNKIWDSFSDDQIRYVLFDFAQDQFVNYKNKEIIKDLMEIGIIDCHELTGRLKLMSPSFRLFVLSKRKKDQVFIKNFKDESKNGTFSKLKFPILLLSVSAMTLLLYLNKDSYDNVTLVGGSIVSVLAFINKFIEANKSI